MTNEIIRINIGNQLARKSQLIANEKTVREKDEELSMLIPDVVPISQMREPAKIFELVQNGPVILTQRSKSAAVLVSIDDWNERERHVEILEAKLRYLEVKQQFRKNPPDLLTLEEIRREYKSTEAEA